MPVSSDVMGDDEIVVPPGSAIISKTDPKGYITYANDLFVNISGFAREELMGKQHNIIRHPDMPRSIFKLMWDRISRGEELHVYVKNRTKQGQFYWVLAKVSPIVTTDMDPYRRGKGYNFPTKKIVGYQSWRITPPDREVLPEVAHLYGLLRKLELSTPNPREGLAIAYRSLTQDLSADGLCYDDIFARLFEKHVAEFPPMA